MTPWDSDKSTAADSDNPAPDEQVTADEWDAHVAEGHFPADELNLGVDGGDPVMTDPQNGDQIVLRYDRSAGSWVFESVTTADLNNKRVVAPSGDGFSSLQAAHDDLPTEGGVIGVAENVTETGIQFSKPVKLTAATWGEFRADGPVSIDTAGGNGIEVLAPIVVEDVSITGDGSSSAGSYGFKLGDPGVDVRFSELRGLKVRNKGDEGIRFEGAHVAGTYEIIAEQNGGHGVVFNTGVDSFDFLNGVHFTTSLAQDNGGDGFHFEGGRVKGNVFTNFTSQRNTGWGLYQASGGDFESNRYIGYGTESNGSGAAHFDVNPARTTICRWRRKDDSETFESVGDGTVIFEEMESSETEWFGEGHKKHALNGRKTASSVGEHGLEMMTSLPPGATSTETYAGYQDNWLAAADRKYTVSFSGTATNLLAAFTQNPNAQMQIDAANTTFPATLDIDFGTSVNYFQVFGVLFSFDDYADVTLEYTTDGGSSYSSVSSKRFEGQGVAGEFYEGNLNGVTGIRYTFENPNTDTIRVKAWANCADGPPEAVVTTDGFNPMYDDLTYEALGRGPVIKSPDGTTWRIEVDNSGNLSTNNI